MGFNVSSGVAGAPNVDDADAARPHHDRKCTKMLSVQASYCHADTRVHVVEEHPEAPSLCALNSGNYSILRVLSGTSFPSSTEPSLFQRSPMKTAAIAKGAVEVLLFVCGREGFGSRFSAELQRFHYTLVQEQTVKSMLTLILHIV